MAMAGGVTVIITPDGFIGFSQAGMLSPDGKCKAFAAEANGFVRGEGAGIVLLKPLSQAIADGDPIQGVILGSSLNQDGHTNGISLPSTEAQCGHPAVRGRLRRSPRHRHGGRRSYRSDCFGGSTLR
jgi:acyl transferase domain-containing protein